MEPEARRWPPSPAEPLACGSGGRKESLADVNVMCGVKERWARPEADVTAAANDCENCWAAVTAAALRPDWVKYTDWGGRPEGRVGRWAPLEMWALVGMGTVGR